MDPVLQKYKIKTSKPLFKKPSKRILGGAKTMSSYTTPILLKFSEDIDVKAVVNEFNQSQYIEFAQPNYIYQISKPTASLTSQAVPNDPDYVKQTGFSLINIEKTWDISLGDSDVVIAVIDTGVKVNHEDLKDNIWINDKEIKDNGIDDDTNGFVDDFQGWDFSDDDNDPSDKKISNSDINGHGTHVAGIIAARASNNIGISGVCGHCKIMALRAGANNAFKTTTISESIHYAIVKKADIINMSFGGQVDDTLIQNKIQEAIAADILLVAAAGNDKKILKQVIQAHLYPHPLMEL